jgi:site-specific recombinase XerC
MRHACVKEVWSGIKRKLGTAQTQKSAATTEYVKRMLDHVPSNLIGVRDRAMLLIGFSAALRRSELVLLAVEDVQFVPEGAVLRLRRSKTDQEGAGANIGIPFGERAETCPVGYLRAWLLASGISSGAIFRGVNRHGQLQINALTSVRSWRCR